MADCNGIAASLSDWLDTAQGRYVLAREQAYFDHTLGQIFGFNALQIGLPQQDFLRNSRMSHHFSGAADAPAGVRMQAEEMPFACASLDLVVLPHVLEFSAQPHQVLREISRVLIAEGHLVISGFNPYSLWGLHRKLRHPPGYPWCSEFIALTRLKDWLSLLGFEVVGGRFAAYAPPLQTSHWLEQRFAFMEAAGDRWWAISGGVYMLHAIKRVPGMHLIKPVWHEPARSRLLPAVNKLGEQ